MSARAISRRLFSPPERTAAFEFSSLARPNSSTSSSLFLMRSAVGMGESSRMALRFCSTVNPLKTLGSCER